MTATLTYSGTTFATIQTSAIETLNSQALIKGSNGQMIVSVVDEKEMIRAM